MRLPGASTPALRSILRRSAAILFSRCRIAIYSYYNRNHGRFLAYEITSQLLSVLQCIKRLIYLRSVIARAKRNRETSAYINLIHADTFTYINDLWILLFYCQSKMLILNFLMKENPSPALEGKIRRMVLTLCLKFVSLNMLHFRR